MCWRWLCQYLYQLKISKLESKLEYFFSRINCFQIDNFGIVQNFTIHIIGDFTSFLSALASNNAFLIKMGPSGTLDVMVRTFKLNLDRFFNMINLIIINTVTSACACCTGHISEHGWSPLPITWVVQSDALSHNHQSYCSSIVTKDVLINWQCCRKLYQTCFPSKMRGAGKNTVYRESHAQRFVLKHLLQCHVFFPLERGWWTLASQVKHAWSHCLKRSYCRNGCVSGDMENTQWEFRIRTIGISCSWKKSKHAIVVTVYRVHCIH